MPSLDSEERSALYLAGLLTGEEAAAYERDLAAATDRERAAFAEMNDAAALVVMASVPRRAAPAAARDAVMAATGIAASPPAPALDKFTYLMNDEGWDPPLFPGARIKPLFTNPKGGHRVFLLELQPGVYLPEHPHAGYEECLILQGDLINEGRRMGPGDYVRATPSTKHLDVYTEQGCLCVIIASAA
jgi:anti-sigma factor ChrR (cupin superfamily)